jgi:hypothetical protein
MAAAYRLRKKRQHGIAEPAEHVIIGMLLVLEIGQFPNAEIWRTPADGGWARAGVRHRTNR